MKGILTIEAFDADAAQSNRKQLLLDVVELEVGGTTHQAEMLLAPGGGGHYVFRLNETGHGMLRLKGSAASDFPFAFPIRVVPGDSGAPTFGFDTTECLDVPKMVTLSSVGIEIDGTPGARHYRAEVVLRPAQEVVLVSGHNYQNLRFSTRILAITRMRDLAEGKTDFERVGHGPAAPDPPRCDVSTVITLFDMDTGYRSRWVVGSGKPKVQKGMWTDGWCRLDRVLQGTEEPKLGNMATDREGFDPGINAISITHVYRYLEEVGRDRPGTLIEWSTFGHAQHGGPIMFDTYEQADFKSGGKDYPKRDPFDHDARMKDISSVNMDASLIATAFVEHPHIKNWGCFVWRRARNLAQRAGRASAGAKLGIPEDERRGAVYVFKSDGSLDADLETFGDTRDGMIDFFRRSAYGNCYAYFIANVLKKPVWASPPGLGSDYLIDGHRWYWSYVPYRVVTLRGGTRKEGAGYFRREVEFYKKFLTEWTFSKDHYLLYRPGAIKSGSASAAARFADPHGRTETALEFV